MAEVRRKMGFWDPFNIWWREHVAQYDKRPSVTEMKGWYDNNASMAWGPEGPSWEETKKHSKGMRRLEDIPEYFRKYRKERKTSKGGACSMDSDDEEDGYQPTKRQNTGHARVKASSVHQPAPPPLAPTRSFLGIALPNLPGLPFLSGFNRSQGSAQGPQHADQGMDTSDEDQPQQIRLPLPGMAMVKTEAFDGSHGMGTNRPNTMQPLPPMPNGDAKMRQVADDHGPFGAGGLSIPLDSVMLAELASPSAPGDGHVGGVAHLAMPAAPGRGWLNTLSSQSKSLFGFESMFKAWGNENSVQLNQMVHAQEQAHAYNAQSGPQAMHAQLQQGGMHGGEGSGSDVRHCAASTPAPMYLHQLHDPQHHVPRGYLYSSHGGQMPQHTMHDARGAPMPGAGGHHSYAYIPHMQHFHPGMAVPGALASYSGAPPPAYGMPAGPYAGYAPAQRPRRYPSWLMPWAAPTPEPRPMHPGMMPMHAGFKRTRDWQGQGPDAMAHVQYSPGGPMMGGPMQQQQQQQQQQHQKPLQSSNSWKDKIMNAVPGMGMFSRRRSSLIQQQMTHEMPVQVSPGMQAQRVLPPLQGEQQGGHGREQGGMHAAMAAAQDMRPAADVRGPSTGAAAAGSVHCNAAAGSGAGDAPPLASAGHGSLLPIPPLDSLLVANLSGLPPMHSNDSLMGALFAAGAMGNAAASTQMGTTAAAGMRPAAGAAAGSHAGASGAVAPSGSLPAANAGSPMQQQAPAYDRARLCSGGSNLSMDTVEADSCLPSAFMAANVQATVEARADKEASVSAPRAAGNSGVQAVGSSQLIGKFSVNFSSKISDMCKFFTKS